MSLIDLFHFPFLIPSDVEIALLSMGEESLLGIVDLINGERDPRNLMITFSIIRVVIVEWDIAEHVDVGVNFSPS